MDEKWMNTFQKGKEKVVHVSKQVASKLDETVEDVLENETVQELFVKSEETIAKVWHDERVQSIVEKAKDGVHRFQEDEHVKNGVKKLKRGTLKAADYAYEGLNRLLKDEEEEIEINLISFDQDAKSLDKTTEE